MLILQILYYKQWKKHEHEPGPTIRGRIINIGESLWYSSSHKTHYEQGENGITEYNLRLQKKIGTTQYPDHITPYRQFCCQHKDNIYIIDGENGEIVLFDPVLRIFTKKINIPKIGTYPSAVVIFDEIHILFGEHNSMHLVYDINKNEVHSYESTLGRSKFVAALWYQNRIILFGGWSYAQNKIQNEFKISNEIERIHDCKINWTIEPQYKFPKTPVYFHGYILYKHYILTFGGRIYTKGSGWSYTDSIHLLDLNKEYGWKEVKHIKCPYPGHFVEVITTNNIIHLFTETNKWPNWEDSDRGHHSLPVSTILGSEFVADEPSKQLKPI